MAQRTAHIVFASTLLLIPAAGSAGGFRHDDLGTRAAGLSSAFTAQASDPSAIFYNPGGVAFLEKPGLLVGTSIVRLQDATFQGLSPGDAAGTNGEQEGWTDYLVHAYWTKPLNPAVVIGVGLYQPFDLHTAWQNADTFAGRGLTTSAELTTYDLVPTLSLRLTNKLGLGIGGVYRSSELSHSRRLARFNPLTGETVDIANVGFKTDMEGAFGWQLGLLHKASKAFSWGLTYRSAIETTYNGAGQLTQIATGSSQFDDLVRATTPFGLDLPVATSLELPETASFGLAFHFGKALTLELDADWTAWSSIQEVPLDFVSEPQFSQAVTLQLDDTLTYRAGVLLNLPSGSELRFGYAFSETSQLPTTLSPFFADADTNSASLGWGKDWLGIALRWSQSDDVATRTSVDDINGVYGRTVWAVTLAVEM
ncbi:MAG: outer membrane protein transport protein [Acidobacteria bacterium]|nr:outer membrane protein transport protein [Acidobacteriota bacterium]